MSIRHLTNQPIISFDLADVKGQHQARRALEIAAAGGIRYCFVVHLGQAKP